MLRIKKPWVAAGALLVAVLGAPDMVSAQNATPDYWRCENRVNGEWAYGRAPMGCDARAFGADSVVQRDMKSLIFDDFAPREPERLRYMDELHATVRAAAELYYKRRQPNAPQAELDAWLFLVWATASHESYVSHYRMASDNRLKMMRGDFGHGHGLMQVDDRAHFAAVNRGLAWHAVSNMTYGMDVLYPQWVRAATASCVGGATNWRARSRAAWAAYNGGPARLCRWTNPNDRWAKNDVNFLSHLDGRPWTRFVRNPAQVSNVNVACLMENQENCPPPGGIVPPPRWDSATLYQFGDQRFCVYVNNRFHCVSEFRDSLCLQHLAKFTGDVVKPAAKIEDLPNTLLERGSLCRQFEASLASPGSFIEVRRTINLRATPGGGLVGSVPQGSLLQVQDFEVRDLNLRERYYRVRHNNLEGWIFAGSSQNHQDWAVVTTRRPVSASVAQVGEMVRVRNSAGINLRETIGGRILTVVRPGQLATVVEVIVQNSTNEVYYRVRFSSFTGFIYSGQLQPTDTVNQWTERFQP